MHVLMGVEAEYLDRAFGVIEAAYGGVESYLRDTLGIDPGPCAAVRDRCLSGGCSTDRRAWRGRACSASPAPAGGDARITGNCAGGAEIEADRRGPSAPAQHLRRHRREAAADDAAGH